jgi:DNA-directed RNA polymerase subunit beta
MEVWALEGFGAAYTLQELLTIKSDDMRGRNLAFMSIIRGNLLPTPGMPESFKVLVSELRGLCLDISLSRITRVS